LSDVFPGSTNSTFGIAAGEDLPGLASVLTGSELGTGNTKLHERHSTISTPSGAVRTFMGLNWLWHLGHSKIIGFSFQLTLSQFQYAVHPYSYAHTISVNKSGSFLKKIQDSATL
jgi:hypothetical protein